MEFIEIFLLLLLAVLALVAAAASVLYALARSELGKARALLDKADARSAMLEAEKSDMSQKLAVAVSERNAARLSLEEAKKSESALSEIRTELEKRLAASDERLSAMADRIAEREDSEKKNREKLSADFEILSNRIFESAREKLSLANAEKLGAVIEPLSAGIKDFRERMESVNAQALRNNANVSAQIDNLINMNARLGDEARNLAQALRSNNKAAGNWGEQLFERILESCGFIDGVHYRTQNSFHDFSGAQKRLVPDFIIDLPESRSIIVDSKLSLLDFVNYTSASDPASKRAHLEKFKKSVRAHLDEFAGKYNGISGVESGFKIMFMPVEPAYNLAVSEDSRLLADAYNKNVLIASPSTVMSILKFAEIAYRNDAFAKNMVEISAMGRLLYERVELFLQRFDKLGVRISQLSKEYEDSKLTLSSGSKSVMSTAKRFYEKSRKAIDAANGGEADARGLGGEKSQDDIMQLSSEGENGQER